MKWSPPVICFYVLDGPNATITFVDINGSVVVVPNATPIVVNGNKANK